MPCDDRSRTESCPPCPETEDKPLFAPGAEEYYRKVLKLDEPKGSERSSTELCECGHPGASHHWHAARGDACIGNRNLCSCRMFRLAEKPERKKCGYSEHGFRPFQGYKDEPGKPHCLTCGHVWGECSWHWVEGDPPHEEPTQPPLTPEEEEQAPGYEELARQRAEVEEELSVKEQEMQAMADAIWPSEEEEQAPEGEPRCTCGETACESELCDCDSAPCPVDHAREAREAVGKKDPGTPPQPDRRPPYAVAYSVQGHLYEVALPGDAAVRAVDGALVIQHALGPVAGICQVLPVINEESNGPQ